MLLKRLAVFGDSIMKGVEYVSERYRLSNERLKPEGTDVVNFSRFGCTSDKGAEIVERALPKLESGTLAVLEYGGNDSDFDWLAVSERPDDVHLPRVSVERFESTLRGMIGRLRDNGVIPLLMTLPPIDPYRYFDFVSRRKNADNILRWLGRREKIYTFQEQYSLAVFRVGTDTKAPVVDVRAAFLSLADFLPLLCDDGVHPNEEGHRLIHREVESFLAAAFAG